MKTILVLLASVASAFSQHTDMWKSMEADARASSIQSQLLINGQNQRQAAANNSVSASTGNVPISEMTDIGLLMQISKKASGKGSNMAMRANIRKQVAARIQELSNQANTRSNPGQLKYGESKLPPKTQTAQPPAQPARLPQATQLMLFDATSGRLVPYNDMNLATLTAAEEKLTGEQFEANVQQTEALVMSAYPCAKIENHPIHTKAEEIFSALEKINSPISKMSTSSWVVYQQAAEQLGIVQQSK